MAVKPVEVVKVRKIFTVKGETAKTQCEPRLRVVMGDLLGTVARALAIPAAEVARTHSIQSATAAKNTSFFVKHVYKKVNVSKVS